MSFWTRLVSGTLAWFFRLSPSILRRGFANFLAWLWFDALKLRRFTILRNLTIVFPELQHEKKLEMARKSMRSMCYNFVEFCLLPFLNRQNFMDHVEFHGLENWEKAQAQGKGVLFLSLHLGNGDQAIALLTLKGIPLNVISKKFRNKFAHEFWFGVREKLGTKFIEPHGPKTPFDILKACRKNEAVIFVIDQFMGPPYGIETQFFGRKTGTAYGLALFALKTEAPVVPVYTCRDNQGKTHVYFEPEVVLDLRRHPEDRDLQIKYMTEEYNRVVESLILKVPDQWMWVHRRWKTWRIT